MITGPTPDHACVQHPPFRRGGREGCERFSDAESLKNPPTARSFFWPCVALLALTAAVILFFDLGSHRTFGSHEAFAAVPAREMLQTGDWIVPHYAGLPRLKKPPLVYWTIAAVSWPWGDVTHWTARLPQAVSAVLLAALVGWWAARWYGRVAGFGAAFAQLTAVWVMIWGRKAEVDMQLCLFTTAALALVATSDEAESKRQAFGRGLGFYALLSLAWLAKFHYGPAMVLAPAALWLLLERRGRTLRRLALHPIGLPLLSAAVFVWPLLLLERIPDALAIWKHETVGRAIGGFGYEPWWFYLPHLLWLPLPWTPFAVAVMPESFRRAFGGLWRTPHGDGAKFQISNFKFQISNLRSERTGDTSPARERFLWLWLIATFAIAMLSANKHKHYLLAMFPAVSLLAGQSIALIVARARQGKPLLTGAWAAFWSCGLLAATAAILLIAAEKSPAILIPSACVAALMLAGGLAALWLTYFRRWQPAALATLTTLLICHVGVTGWILPRHDRRAAIAEFAATVRASHPAPQRVLVYGLETHSVIYYLDGPVRRYEDHMGLKKGLPAGGEVPVITSESLAPTLCSLGAIRRITGTNPAVPLDPPLVLLRLAPAALSVNSPRERQKVAYEASGENETRIR